MKETRSSVSVDLHVVPWEQFLKKKKTAETVTIHQTKKNQKKEKKKWRGYVSREK
jgi:hypothetical protein